MAKTDPINVANPTGGSDPKLGDDYIRALALAVIEILNVDHYVGAATNNAYDEDAAGGHKQITLNAPLGANPSNVANKGFLYTKDVSDVVELFWEDESGNVKQLTTGGKINAVDADGIVLKAGAQTGIAGAKTFTGVVTLADTSALATAGAPVVAAQIANKAYVDAQVAAATPDDDAFGAWATDPSGYATNVLAASDGFVVAMTTTSNVAVSGYTDGNSPPTTKRCANTHSTGGQVSTIVMPVKKGNRWKVTGSTSRFWIPIGA